MTVQLYDDTNIDSLPWPQTEDGEYAKKFLLPFIKNGPEHYIDNADTKMYALTMDDLVLPITINDNQYNNSFVCSPYTHYVLYPLDEFKILDGSLLSRTLTFLLRFTGKIFRWGKMNKVVFVNNWLLSTNLYLPLTKNQINTIRNHLTKHFPEHAIAFRSINTYNMSDTYQALNHSGFHFIMSRPIYFIDTKSKKPFKARMFKSDMRVLEKTDYEIVDSTRLTPEDAPRIAELYRSLNIDKYSQFNPKFNDNFVVLALKNGILQFKVLRKNNQIDGVLGYFYRNGVLTSPFFGYDTSKPQTLGLYRLISHLLTLEAKDRNHLLHASSGAGSYKKLRRAEQTMEWTAVYAKHLPLRQRFTWGLVRAIANGIGLRVLRFYEP